MTDEELFKVYIKRELCANCRFPQLCKGEDVCSHIATAKRHYLAGVEAGKSQAETDLAIVAYMQGAESGYNKAFVEADKNLKAIVTDFNKAKEIIRDLLQVLPKENIEGIYEITEEAEQFLRGNE